MTTSPDPLRVRRHFRAQAESCAELGSPFTASLCRYLGAHLHDGLAFDAAVLAWPDEPGADALALRVCAGLHALALSGAAPDLVRLFTARTLDDTAANAALDAARRDHAATLRDVLASPPQTNEVGRSAMVYPGLLLLRQLYGQPIDLYELGASAGLNLHLDAYAYELGGHRFGRDDAPLTLRPQWRGALAPPRATLRVRRRAACDINPRDPADPHDRLRLCAYVWADQDARQERLQRALDHAAARPERVTRADAAEWLATALATRPRGVTSVVMHTVFWQYLPRATQRRLFDRLGEHGERADHTRPLAWLRLEPAAEGGAEVRLDLWPAHRTWRLARADFHGRWIDWRGQEALA